MRNYVCLPAFAILTLATFVVPAHADDRALVFLFGPLAPDKAPPAAQAAAASARNWLKIPGASAEIRRPGNGDSQELAKFMAAKDIEAALLDAARASSQLSVMEFIDTLDRATYVTARRAGKRVLVVIAESPLLAGEAEHRLKQTIEFCRSNAVRVLVIDPSATGSAGGAPALEPLASSTGGAFASDPKTLEGNLLIVAPVDKPGSESDAAKPVQSAPTGIPVYARLVRKRLPWKPGNIDSDMGPTRGAMLVEAPLSALQFEEKGSDYQVRAVLTAMVKNADGKTVWQAKNDFNLKGPYRKLQERRTGELYFIRDVTLPGGKYTVEASVEDLNAGKSGNFSEPLSAATILPGFSMSDAFFVRKLNESADKMQGDQVLAYEGRALAPLLNPGYPADRPFNLELYFIMYPDLRGGQPHISVEILRDGQSVGRSELPFNDSIRDTSRENQDVGPGAGARNGEQKGAFPYLATIRDASFSAGQYEARVTVRQDKQTITRSAPFRVLN